VAAKARTRPATVPRVVVRRIDMRTSYVLTRTGGTLHPPGSPVPEP
jgi:hypothetical protein